MIFEIEDTEEIMLSPYSLLAGTVAITFFFVGLLSVYTRNEEYDSRKTSKHKSQPQNRRQTSQTTKSMKSSESIKSTQRKQKYVVESSSYLPEMNMETDANPSTLRKREGRRNE